MQSQWGDDFMREFDKLLDGTESAARAKRKYEAATLEAERVQEESIQRQVHAKHNAWLRHRGSKPGNFEMKCVSWRGQETS